MPRYRITGGPDGNAGLNYKAKRVEVGEIVDDIPRESVKWLREQGYIEIEGKEDPTPDPVEEPAPIEEPVPADPEPTEEVAG